MSSLEDIRARHALAQERLDANGPGPRMTLTLAAAHADRAALLAALDAMTHERDILRITCAAHITVILAASLRFRAKAAAAAADVWTWDDERLVDLALGNLESALGRAKKAQAALDRLAAACEALRTRSDARDYLPAEYDAVVEALDRARVERGG